MGLRKGVGTRVVATTVVEMRDPTDPSIPPTYTQRYCLRYQGTWL